MWKNKDCKKKGITQDNLLIVDDTPSTYSENYGNAIPIEPFVADNYLGDKELMKLIFFMKDLKKETKSVRKIEKRFWSKKYE